MNEEAPGVGPAWVQLALRRGGAEVLHGRVGEGQGLASGKHKRGGGLWLRAPLFTRLLGPIYPASINVYVEARDRFDLVRTQHPYFRDRDESVRQEDVRKQGFLLVRPCLVNGKPGYVLRTEHPGPEHKGRRPPPIGKPHTMFEVVARKRLSWVQYGAQVQLTVDLSEAPLMLHVRGRR